MRCRDLSRPCVSVWSRYRIAMRGTVRPLRASRNSFGTSSCWSSSSSRKCSDTTAASNDAPNAGPAVGRYTSPSATRRVGMCRRVCRMFSSASSTSHANSSEHVTSRHQIGGVVSHARKRGRSEAQPEQPRRLAQLTTDRFGLGRRMFREVVDDVAQVAQGAFGPEDFSHPSTLRSASS